MANCVHEIDGQMCPRNWWPNVSISTKLVAKCVNEIGGQICPRNWWANLSTKLVGKFVHQIGTTLLSLRAFLYTQIPVYGPSNIYQKGEAGDGEGVGYFSRCT